MSSPLSDNLHPVAERAASESKETDDPGSLPTLDAPPIPPPLGVPSRLLGEYELLERLGGGGMGEVYKARHRRLDKLVALKLLHADSPHRREVAARFQREMKAVGAVDHPNVVEAHDAGEQAGVVYLAMKLIDGVDLERMVKQRGPLPIAEACDLVRQAGLGLHYLHERGLVHRDMKPSNLMKTADGTVKVLDLGLARWRGEAERGANLTGTGRVLGTPDFLAPEQIESAANAEARADLYALGGTLFYLLTGRAPFAHRDSVWAKLDAQRSEVPPDVRTLRPDVPPAVAEVVRRLLAKKPEERFATAAEVADKLASFVDLPPTLEAPAFAAMPTTPGKRRWPWFVAAAAGIILATLLLLLARDRSEHRPPSSPQQSEVQAPQPIHVMTLDVKLTRYVKGRPRAAGLLGVDVFDPHLGDTVTVEARLTRPAYAFLMAFRPDGVAEICFPVQDDQQPCLTDKPSYPFPIAQGPEYGLTDGTGLAAFAVVVSDRPLPSFTEWWSRNEGCPWKKESGPLGLVYRGNGEDAVELSDANGPRGKGADVKGKTPIAELAVWLRHRPGIETVKVLGLAVGPRAKE